MARRSGTTRGFPGLPDSRDSADPVGGPAHPHHRAHAICRARAGRTVAMVGTPLQADSGVCCSDSAVAPATLRGAERRRWKACSWQRETRRIPQSDPQPLRPRRRLSRADSTCSAGRSRVSRSCAGSCWTRWRRRCCRPHRLPPRRCPDSGSTTTRGFTSAATPARSSPTTIPWPRGRRFTACARERPCRNHPQSGLLRFFDPRQGASAYVDPANESLHAPFALRSLDMRLAAGDLVVFPSYLFHEVTPFYGADTRITVATNCWFA